MRRLFYEDRNGAGDSSWFMPREGQSARQATFRVRYLWLVNQSLTSKTFWLIDQSKPPWPVKDIWDRRPLFVIFLRQKMRFLWSELLPNFQLMCILCDKQLFIFPAIILNFMKFWYLSDNYVISVSPGVIFLTGHMTGWPFNSVNLLVKSWSSQCFRYLTLMV